MNSTVDPPAPKVATARSAGWPSTRYQRTVDAAQLRWWTPTAYVAYRGIGRFIWFCTIRAKVIRADIPQRPGGYLLACTHLSHLEPILVGICIKRHIDYMTRIEFYSRWWLRSFFNAVGAFPVNRQGVPVSAIRTAIQRAIAGRIVGIFPEGGVAVGPDSICAGGKIKRGVCLIAYRADVPVIPCVTLGTRKLNTIAPWLPFRRARVWIAFGEPIWPDKTLMAKAAREQMSGRLERACVALCQDLVAQGAPAGLVS